eukprot:CAMPEP_0198232158 /NCGR_PEP_ID=MMETSP1445-20131203/115580_1 /TAXON_ID=36898 /ORGANISM="Pyramimonas sp., Strain CCMP2087" /LENGTH=53 /DNA_ID=CAMNT_0043912809 /DNA_START=365 /DNA_END=526 /DNA_ORIENTATION=-
MNAAGRSFFAASYLVAVAKMLLASSFSASSSNSSASYASSYPCPNSSAAVVIP